MGRTISLSNAEQFCIQGMVGNSSSDMHFISLVAPIGGICVSTDKFSWNVI